MTVRLTRFFSVNTMYFCKPTQQYTGSSKYASIFKNIVIIFDASARIENSNLTSTATSNVTFRRCSGKRS